MQSACTTPCGDRNAASAGVARTMIVTSYVMVTWIFTPPMNGKRIVRARAPKRSASGTIVSEWTS
eukprot:11844256-Heterocapsa_arctica.AAC.1